MRDAVRIILTVAAVIFAVQAWQRFASSPSTYVNSSHAKAIGIAAL